MKDAAGPAEAQKTHIIRSGKVDKVAIAVWDRKSLVEIGRLEPGDTLVMGAGDAAATAEEMSDLLFAVTNLARHLKIDPEEALSAANRKFEQRFRAMEQAIAASGKPIQELVG